MTKHWDEFPCIGCEYLRKYGLPEDFIYEDHIQETICLVCGHSIGKHNTTPEVPDCVMFGCGCQAQTAGGA